MAARDLLARAREARSRPLLHVRVAPLDSGEIDRDLEALIPSAPDGVFLPSACGCASVQHLSAKLAVHEAEAGLRDGATRIVAIATQTPAAVFGLGSYAAASRRLAALSLDLEDLRSALGLEALPSGRSSLEPPLALARSLALLGAAAARVPAIDAPLLDVGDEEGLLTQCLAARREGFSGKLAIAPAQVRIINEAFVDLGDRL